MSGFSAEINSSDLASLKGILEDFTRDGDKWVKQALNDGARKGKTTTSTAVFEKLNLKKNKINKRLSVRFASLSKLQSALRIKSGNIPLEEFTGTRISKTKSKPGAIFQIWRVGAKEQYRHAFGIVAGNRYDTSQGIWEREINAFNYDGRGPIRRKFGPSIATAFEKTPGIEEKTLNDANAKVIERLNHYINLTLGR